MDFKQMCIQQGYVPSTCQMDGKMCWQLINNGKDPCEGCYNNRSQCNGRHAPYENEIYCLGHLLDTFVESNRKNRLDEELRKLKDEAERQEKHVKCNAKVVLSITVELNRFGKSEIEIKVNGLVRERGYIKMCNDIEEAVSIIPAIVSIYKIEQIQCEMNGYGIGIYDALKKLELNIDIVPITYRKMTLDY